MTYSLQGCTVFLIQTSVLLQEIESGVLKNQTLFRIFTPILKLFTAKECMRCMTEAIESFGALGYLEDSGIPVIARDA